MDKAFWRSIAEQGFVVPDGYSLAELTTELLEYLGSTDAELRDGIAYVSFYHWIYKKPQYSLENLRRLRDQLLDNLLVGIHQSDNDGVLLRSFSALVLSLIIYRDNAESFLSEDEIAEIVELATRYLQSEQDLRGYVDNIGWIHALAHTADLLKFLIRNPKTLEEHHEYILQSIANKLTHHTSTILRHDEDERLALTVMEITKRALLEPEAIVAILNQFIEWKAHNQSDEFDATLFATHQNIKNFLRSWYFQLTKPDTQLAEAYAGIIPAAVERAVRSYNF